jgi:hypothetical protein
MQALLTRGMPWLWIVRVDWIIFGCLWINWRLFIFLFTIRKEGCLPYLTTLLLQNMIVRLQHCTDSSSNRTAPFPVRINAA